MEIDNNQLVARYYKLQHSNQEYFNAVREYIEAQIQGLYDRLETTFQDTVMLSVQDAIAYAAQKDVKLAQRVNVNLATLNFIVKTLDDLGILIDGGAKSPDVVIGKLNFENRARYM
ncbi:hypothetical protein PQ472_02395 [Lacticaseibacillus pabuli]|uniref:Uncharacterized protein n=1 Tax=Lacticaseibacillus pabuli TaxID=3025672 RepID=A0ABY7WSE1_9LACO|nr:hypothetical protein [Lacticaseibacillus sp. KACC 23028]WDF83103.1 hypothetical protein PQ472_02395 [Lacticaseibacillus sp. KACC 23028]